MKKLISVLLVLGMVLSLCACGGGESAPEQPAAPAETAAPTPEELAAQALELYHSADYTGLFEALPALEDSGLELAALLEGLCRYYGLGAELDQEAGVELLEPMKDSSPMAAYILAHATRSGEGAPQDPEGAQELYAAFINMCRTMDDSTALMGSVYTALAQCYSKGLGTEIDMDKALTAADKALRFERTAFDTAELAAFLRETAQGTKDNIDAQLAEHGLGIIDLEDDSKCAGLKERAEMQARLSQAGDQLKTAAELCSIARDDIEALAGDENLIALKLMGDYYFGALGGESRDYAKAMEYYMLAADLDYAPAQAQIALMYQDGLGVDVSYEQAMEWNNRAAQQGNAQGQAQIGYLYHMGLGVTQNLDEAGRWYSRAADQGNTWAAAKLVQTEITNPQLAFEFHA